MRSATGTKSAEPCFVTLSTKATIDFLAAPTFHDGSGSEARAADVVRSAAHQASVDHRQDRYRDFINPP
jgi:hypothetical protein